MTYNFPVPHSRGFRPDILDHEDLEAVAEAGDKIKDMFLHALFARIAANDDDVWEFETEYNQKSNTIDLLISEKFISIIENVNKGNDFNRYIKWLIEDAVTDVTNGLFWSLVDGTDDTMTTAFKAIFEKSASYNNVKTATNSGPTAEVNWCVGNKQSVSLTEDTVISFVDPPGPSSLQLIMTQSNGGDHSPTFPPNVLFPNGTQPSSTSSDGSVDIWSFLFDGTKYYGTAVRNFA